MRGSKAKRIRKAIYGDQSQKQERTYGMKNGRRVFDQGKFAGHTFTLFNQPDSLRARYQKAKKAMA